MVSIARLTPSTSYIRTLQILNIVGYGIMVLMNFLANWLPINGNTTGEISDEYDSLFTPAGLTFSIWGLIYLLLLIFTSFQASTLFTRRPTQTNSQVLHIGVWYFVSSLLNALWIVAWHFELIPVSVSIMMVLLLSLMLTNFGIYNYMQFLSQRARLLTKACFGIYLGWICVATIANIAAWLSGIHWTGGITEESWAIIMILAGGVLTLSAASQLDNYFITLAVIWAYIGIVVKRFNTSPVYHSIMYAAGGAALILLVFTILGFVKAAKRSKINSMQPAGILK